ncbi:cyclic beta-1,2-glucan synthetase [Alicyclobacillus hesperidum]|uniref:Cyclic beta-1,2-glucan synthetase n=1 Tax=Alicyclobacillus hesperidum TaxID=89784 RepID=A0A1H2XKC6_9BACL|nr:glucoamylase family protein [Alicyclobacillus hesperidum]SDW93196.1 cyclic beta-1,2-glucan synthetase [Alicyclobacillus hesperidum]
MILTDTELQVRAHEFALTDEIDRSRNKGAQLWPDVRRQVAQLRSFASLLEQKRSACAQPAEDWLLDHVAFIEMQAQVAEREWPRKTLCRLPHLHGAGRLRVLALCDDYLDSVDGRYDEHTFVVYIQAFQEVAVLTAVECATLPNALRVAIIERLAASMAEVRRRHEVCHDIERLLDDVGKTGPDEQKVRRLLERRTGGRPLSPVELVHFVHHLSEWEPDIQVVREWLTLHIENNSESLERIVSLEHQLQAELQVRCGNLVQSLHRLERLAWRSIFSRICRVDQIFMCDPTGDYPRLDANSQDVLRERVVRLAERLRIPEALIAETSVRLAEGAISQGQADREAFFGHYLVDAHGLATLRRALAQHIKPRRLPELAARQRPLLSYLAGAGVLFIALLAVVSNWLTGGFSLPIASICAVIAALLLPVSEWVVVLVHEVIVRCVRPVPLLRYDFSEGLPEEARTMVVMPVIWSSVEDVDDAVNQLLVHHLANRGDYIHFAILADYPDASSRTCETDRELLERAIERIAALQKEYGQHRFYLFHRDRTWNPVDRVYMGWERKRGKLVEFVELLRGKRDTNFTTVLGDTSILGAVRYVFTVDLDTKLPIGVVNRMVGTIHLPYNRPRLNRDGTRVEAGYGVLQPAVSVSHASTQRSRFAALWSGETGIDPYAFAVANPYQDWFGQALFVGKGVFAVDAFYHALVDRIPDNRVLSHDILEGGFLRAGLVADIEVVEDQPATVYAHQRRAHRWIRGDWQLLYWLRRICRDRGGQRRKVDLCGLTRWQIVDHARRSLLPPALFAVLWLAVGGVLPGPAWAWGSVVLVSLFAPFLRGLEATVTSAPPNWRPAAFTCGQNFVQFALLPWTTAVNIDAVARALYRMCISRRKLLEWVPSAHMERGRWRSHTLLYAPVGYGLTVLCCITALWQPTLGRLTLAVVLLCAWLPGHLLAAWLSRKPQMDNRSERIAQHADELRELAKEIWSFYERYVTADDNWLPPDNVQFEPVERIAHRTSPTNIGLYLMCVVAARDLQIIDTGTMVGRLESALRSIASLETWHGHLYNWYDTQSKAPLPPRYVSTVDSGNFVASLIVVYQALAEWAESETVFHERLHALRKAVWRIVEDTDFRPLYSPAERLFALGFHVDRNERESILYDLLASEARQASFVAIALGQIPVSHWFTLSRTMTMANGWRTLLSWSGTMFEYLMPSLIMRHDRNTIWAYTYQGVIRRQQSYADARRVPLGISESGYYAFDYQLNYQYRAFGVPGLGLDRGLERQLVVAPYAALLALPLAPEASLQSLRQFAKLGAKGAYGYYEAVDFTPERMPPGRTFEVIQSFMAHHQGMGMLAITNALLDDVMIRRFHAVPEVQATDYILQERIPRKVALLERPANSVYLPNFDQPLQDGERRLTEADGWEVNALANGSLAVVTTARGESSLRWRGIAVTRWREDRHLQLSGPVMYIHDVDSELAWSATAYPAVLGGPIDVCFRPDKSQFQRCVADIESKLEVVIVPEQDVELRRLELKNTSERPRTLEVTSFVELCLTDPAADLAHPAFAKLFVETGHDEQTGFLFAKRRRRSDQDDEVWAVHTLYAVERESEPYEFETDRAAFIGRGNGLDTPQGLAGRLAGTTGSVADPAFVIRRRLHLGPGESAVLYALTSVANAREHAFAAASALREARQAERAFQLAWVRAQIDLRHAHLSVKQSIDAQRIAAHLLRPSALPSARKRAIEANQLGQSALWAHGLGGDVPILAVSFTSPADLSFVVLVARMHQYLCRQGIAVDLAVIDETKGGYHDALVDQIRDALARRGIAPLTRVAFLKSEQLSSAERTLLAAVVRVWLRAGGPSVAAQLRELLPDGKTERLDGKPLSLRERRKELSRHIDGEFANGYGAFVDGGTAYQICVQPGAHLLRPWTNVIANPQFGCLITELGTGYTWWRNSRECKLTPWNNDPVLDLPGECLYIRDLDTGQLLSATPKPAGGELTYTVTHRFGGTRFAATADSLEWTFDIGVPTSDPVKLMRLVVRNTSNQTRRLAISYYAEWVLGVTREGQSSFVVSDWDEESATLVARNTYQEAFRSAIAFLHMAGDHLGEPEWTADRDRFFGDAGSFARPSGLVERHFAVKGGAVPNACGVVKREIEIQPGSEATIIVLLGCAESVDEVRNLVRTYRDPLACAEAFAETAALWQETLGKVQVATPDRSFDILMNGWLLYQALACRLWARTAFYQAGGAFGFRDQLQDALSLLHADPSYLRAQIVRNASHQYEEGDVQHWWHEETGKGIRTKFSDDLLWLPYAVSRYVEHTGDNSILAVRVPFLTSRPLAEDELERYEDTVVGDTSGTIAEHCLRAVLRALRFGEHGLPLIGIGDWNDGLSRVGAEGRGESVWLAWFLINVIDRMLDLHDPVFSVDIRLRLRNVRDQLAHNVNEHAWDGVWYRRAFTDAGRWLGSIVDRECRIDAIAQSWSVISGAAPPERQQRAMRSFDRELVDRSLQVARLLTPAFDATDPSPGYIQGYPPGIRENGGQYTHGVIWSIVAWARLGRSDKAYELFTMLNPIHHTKTRREVETYGNEPYVMTADIYTASPHPGRAGWSWYTGAAGWMYQAGLEAILGVVRRADRLYIRPCVPPEWDEFTIEYRYHSATYRIRVRCEAGVEAHAAAGLWTLDGQSLATDYLVLADDGREHDVSLIIGVEPEQVTGTGSL